MYDSDILFQVLSFDHDIEEAYYLGHSFLSKLDSLNYESFKKFFALTIERFQNSKLADFRKVGDTFNNWKEEICNSYLLVDDGKRLSNGRIEGRNNKIKTLKKISYGLTNFDHLRKRIFLMFEKNPMK